jgi:hypothetical protein
MAQSPCFFASPCRFPLLPLLISFTYLETLLAVTGSRPPWSQVTRKLTSPFSTPSHPPLFQIPSTQVNYAPHYDDFKIPASLVRNTNFTLHTVSDTQQNSNNP